MQKISKFLLLPLSCAMAVSIFAACGEDQQLEHVHDFTHYSAIETTCEEGGNIEYWVCDNCEKWFADENGNEEITDHSLVVSSSFGHKLTNHPAIDATCEEGGNTAYWICDNCEKWFADENGNEEITDHSLVVSSASGHKLTNHPAIDATCEEVGNIEYWICDNCEKWFVDENGNEELSDHNSVDILATGHTFAEEWTYDDGYHWHKATCGHEIEDKKVTHEFVAGTCSICGYIQEKASVGLEFALNSDSQSYSVIGLGECTDLDIIIPSSHASLLVTSIGFEAFYGCVDITSVIIPDSVTTIEDNAFYWCSGLKSAVVGDGVTDIGARAFGYCINMTSIVIGSNVMSIGDDQFVNCSDFNVYYNGNEEAWKQIQIGNSNTELLGVNPYCFSETKPSANHGSYWHYDENGVTPVLWKEED